MVEEVLTAPIKQRVLLVEDEQEQAVMFKRWLEIDLNLTVDVVSDGIEGHRLAGRPDYDLIVTDVGLPGRNGLRVLERSKKLFPNRPALVITAFEGRAILLHALRSKADDFIAKPLNRLQAMSRVQLLAAESAKRRLSAQGERERTLTPRSVLAISAHPDDVEIGCGGALLRHRSLGDSVSIVVMSDGVRGGNETKRRAEACASASKLGATIHFAGLQDGAMTDGTTTISPLEGIIREISPDVVYTHSEHDTHQDHRAVARATRVAARTTRCLYCYQSPSTTVEFRPTKFIPIGKHLDSKLELLKEFHSQTGLREYLKPEAIRATAQYWGRFSAFEPAEPLEVVRDNG